MYLYLVRHGQSVGNERGVFYGLSDHPLTELGREQARQAAEKLREVSFTRCVASDLSRAWDTALICAEGRGVEVEPDPRLREQDMGEMEDMPFKEGFARWGDDFHRMLRDWVHMPPPGGEDVAHMKERVGAAVDELVARGEDVLLVAHGGTLSLILSHFGLAARPGWRFSIGEQNRPFGHRMGRRWRKWRCFGIV